MMRVVFILMFLANVTVALISLAVLPDRVAIHFGSDGLADGWGSTMVNTFVMIASHALLFCLFYFSPRLVAVCPRWCVNLPNKDYWLAPENLPQTQKKMQRLMWQFGAVFFLFYFFVGLLALHANLVKPVRLDLKVFFPVFGLFMAYTLVWIVFIYRAFRLPEAKGTP